MLREGSNVDIRVITMQSSDKNTENRRDPRMHQT